MNCLSPIQLKNGYLVLCGQCELCQSSRRTEKSVLVQLHCDSYNRMPLFIGLSYDDDHLPYRHRVNGRYYRKSDFDDLSQDERDRLVPSLYRHDVSSFLKSYKRMMGLTNDKFTYFGCGEYGQDGEYTHRPHYHLIWFGDKMLEQMFDRDVHGAENWLRSFWSHGNVDIGLAEWSGIHYVTKYVLKDHNEAPEYAHPVFTIAGKGIGNAWLNSLEAERIRQRLLYLHFNRDLIYQHINLSELDFNDDQQRLDKYREWLDYLKPMMPDFNVMLPSGHKARLPRKLREKLVGHFQRFSDNPLWLYNDIQQWYENETWWLEHKFYDGDRSLWIQKLEDHATAIQNRIIRNKAKKL